MDWEKLGERHGAAVRRAIDVVGWIAVGIVFGGMAVAPFLPCK